MKKVLSLFLSVLMLTSVVAAVDLSAYAASNSCGENVTYTLEGNTLTISGTGDMTDYSSSSTSSAPWNLSVYYIKNIVIDSGVTSIGGAAFSNCYNLTSITIPDSVTSIGKGAFNGCSSLTSITIPDSVISIGDYAFESCSSLTNITIGNGVLSIGDYAFWYCKSLESITIPDSVTSIGDKAFANCENLTTITIGSSVSSIGVSTFYNCSKLTDAYYNGSICDWTKVDGNNRLSNAEIHYTGNSEHIWDSGTVTTAATCKATGTTKYTCTVCGTTKNVNDIPKLEHIYEYVRTEPTCTKTGSIKKTCTLCGYVDSTETLAATGHSYDGGTVTKEATCKATGSKTYTCTVCGSTKKETIDKLTTHSYENKITKAKYDSNGGSNGKIEKKCSVCKNVKSTTTIYKPKSMSLSKTSYTYDGKAKKPTVTVKDSKGNKISSKYYTVKYVSQSTGKTVSSMKDPGKYYVKITFKTRYSGSMKKAVTIKPKKTSIKSIKASKKGFTVKWGKVTTQTTGYQVQYSTSKNFKSATTTTISKNKTTGAKTAGLKAKKKYYVRVRTYKTVKINGKNTKIYSAWSSVKGVTTKK